MEDFSKPKVVYREISTDMEAAIIPKDWFINNKLYMITGNCPIQLEYICAFLNSKVFSKIILKEVNFGGGKGIDFLGNINLPQISNDTPTNIDDKYFFHLFNLDSVEIQYIETL